MKFKYTYRNKDGYVYMSTHKPVPRSHGMACAGFAQRVTNIPQAKQDSWPNSIQLIKNTKTR